MSFKHKNLVDAIKNPANTLTIIGDGAASVIKRVGNEEKLSKVVVSCRTLYIEFLDKLSFSS